MHKTQIQLPEELYNRLKALSKAKELSLAEILRMGAEYILRVYPISDSLEENWEPPSPRKLGKFKTDSSDWREIANRRES